MGWFLPLHAADTSETFLRATATGGIEGTVESFGTPWFRVSRSVFQLIGTLYGVVDFDAKVMSGAFNHWTTEQVLDRFQTTGCCTQTSSARLAAVSAGA